MIELLKRILRKGILLLERGQPTTNKTKDQNAKLQAQRVVKWFKDKGDETLRLDYTLDSNSVVFDIGGYKGEFARDIFCKYDCSIYFFEPIPEFYEIAKTRFVRNAKVKLYKYGLGDKNTQNQISLEDNSSSTLKEGENTIQIEMRSFNDFILEEGIHVIDLVKINIEGGEYELLESIIARGNIAKIRNIQVQFHDFVIENARERMEAIQKELSKTHILTYQYEFVWENWVLKQ